MRCSKCGARMVYKKGMLVGGVVRKGANMGMLGGAGFLLGGPLGAIIGTGIGSLVAGKGYWQCRRCIHSVPATSWADHKYRK